MSERKSLATEPPFEDLPPQETAKREVKAFEILEGEIQGKTDVEMLQIATRYMKSSMFNKSINTPQLAFGAILFVKQQDMPLSCLPETAYVHGKYFFFGSAFRASAKRAKDFGEDKITELDFDKKEISIKNGNIGEPVYAVCVETRRKGSEIFNLFYFTIDEAKKAGLIRPGSAWTKHDRDMLQHRAFVRSYRANYPDAINNVIEPDGIDFDYSTGEIREVRDNRLNLNDIGESQEKENSGTQTNE